MKREIIFIVLITFLMIIIIVGAFYLIGLDIQTAIIDFKCCNSSTCSDTYYTQEDNLCHLTFCEINHFPHNKDCTYPASDEEIILINEPLKAVGSEMPFNVMWLLIAITTILFVLVTLIIAIQKLETINKEEIKGENKE